MAQKVDEARELSEAIKGNAAASFLKDRQSRWKPMPGKTLKWIMSVGDAEVRAVVVQSAPITNAPERVLVEAELPERLNKLTGSFTVTVREFSLGDVGLKT